jgi:hypothetical protein
MNDTIEQLQYIIRHYATLLAKVSEPDFSEKQDPTKWSKKEMLGHLVDSAQNNIRRFVVAQYEEQPAIGYNQDKWVSAANYQEYNTPDLLALWTLLNKHICMVLRNMDETARLRECKSPVELYSIEWLAADYNKHLLHHLHHLLSLEPVPYP